MSDDSKAVESLEKIENKIDKGEPLTPAEDKILNAVESGEPSEPVEDSEDVAEESPSEKDEETIPSKKEEIEEPAPKKVEADRKAVIEKDAEKPLDEVDIEKYTPRERALFFELKEERQKRQESQKESDTLKFQKAKDEARAQIEAEKAAKEADKEQDPFEGLEDDDLLTAGQLKKLLASKKEPARKETPQVDQAAETIRKMQMENWVLKAQAKIPDVMDVIAYTDEFLVGDPVATAEVTEVVKKGGNPLIASYNYLKASPHWAKIEARLRAKNGDSDLDQKKEEEARTNKERAERIETNKKKPVTTGSGGGVISSGEYTIQELLDMPDEDFVKLPKAQREKVLESF